MLKGVTRLNMQPHFILQGPVLGCHAWWQVPENTEICPCKDISSLRRQKGEDLYPGQCLLRSPPPPFDYWQQNLPTQWRPWGGLSTWSVPWILYYFIFWRKKWKILFKPTWWLIWETDFQEIEDVSQTLFYFLMHLRCKHWMCVPSYLVGVQNENGNIDHVFLQRATSFARNV